MPILEAIEESPIHQAELILGNGPGRVRAIREGEIIRMFRRIVDNNTGFILENEPIIDNQRINNLMQHDDWEPVFVG